MGLISALSGRLLAADGSAAGLLPFGDTAAGKKTAALGLVRPGSAAEAPDAPITLPTRLTRDANRLDSGWLTCGMADRRWVHCSSDPGHQPFSANAQPRWR